jgi:chromosome segregation ATPase
VCPCCTRKMDESEAVVFQDSIANLIEESPFVNYDADAMEKYKHTKASYQNMRKILEGNLGTLSDFRRLTSEAVDLEKEVKRLEEDVTHYSNTLKHQLQSKDDTERELKDVRDLKLMIEKWTEHAGRIAEKKLQIHHKKMDLSAMVTDSSRDLKTVDREIANLREEKESLSTKISRLNKELSEINSRISVLSERVSSKYRL